MFSCFITVLGNIFVIYYTLYIRVLFLLLYTYIPV
nr:MAG TPA: hypothetical protein [Caudoviricetes sp.]